MNYSPLVKDAIRSRYFSGQEPKDIAKSTKVPVKSINQWIDEGKWDTQRRDRIASELHTRGDVIISQEKPNAVERQVRIAQKLDGHVEKALDKKTVTPRDLVNISKAAVASVGIVESALQLKKASSLQVFVQFNLKPLPVQDALRLGVLTQADLMGLPASHKALDIPSEILPPLPLAEDLGYDPLNPPF